jgi:hypothetical protein
MRTSSLHNAILIMNDIRKYDTKKENSQAIAAVLNGISTFRSQAE